MRRARDSDLRAQLKNEEEENVQLNAKKHSTIAICLITVLAFSPVASSDPAQHRLKTGPDQSGVARDECRGRPSGVQVRDAAVKKSAALVLVVAPLHRLPLLLRPPNRHVARCARRGHVLK